MTRMPAVTSAGVLAAVLALGACTSSGPTAPGGAGVGTASATPLAGSLPGGATTTPATGSGASTSSAASTPSSLPPTIGEPTTVEPVLATGRSGQFRVTVPLGWVVATDRAGDVAHLDLVLASSSPVGGYADNLVVLSLPGDAASMRRELERTRSQMSAGGRRVTAAPPLRVGGEPATGFTTTFTQQGLSVVARSYGFVHAGRVYLLTLSSSAAAADRALAELRAVLPTWAWTR